MNDSGGGRALFQSLRVPFDLKAVIVAFLGLVALWVAGLALGSIYKTQYISERIGEMREGMEDPDSDAAKEWLAKERDELSESVEIDGRKLVEKEFVGFIPRGFTSFFQDFGLFQFRGAANVPIELGNWSFGIGFGIVFLIYALFGGGICRIVASRIARDESIGVREALAFSFGNWRDYVLAPVFVFAAILFFYGCNALAGLLTSIPYVGPVLGVALFPLVMLSSVIIILIGFGGVLGLGLMVAAIAVERNGSLDAISRAFSYIYARPVQFFFYLALVLFFTGIIATVGGMLVDVTYDSYRAGTPEGSEAEQAIDQNQVRSTREVMSPKLGGLEKFQGLTGVAVWVLSTLLAWGVKAAALFYLFGGITAIYFLLRREVDGTEESEIYLTDADEDEFDFSVTDAPPPDEPPAPAGDASPEGTPSDDAPSEPEKARDEGDAPEDEAPEAPDAPEASAKDEKPESGAGDDESDEDDEDDEKKPD